MEEPFGAVEKIIFLQPFFAIESIQQLLASKRRNILAISVKNPFTVP